MERSGGVRSFWLEEVTPTACWVNLLYLWTPVFLFFSCVEALKGSICLCVQMASVVETRWRSFVKPQSKDIVWRKMVCWLSWPCTEEQIHQHLVWRVTLAYVLFTISRNEVCFSSPIHPIFLGGLRSCWFDCFVSKAFWYSVLKVSHGVVGR